MQNRIAEARELRSEEASGGSDLGAGVRQAVERAQNRFLSLQSSDGYWHAPLEANVTMDAEYVFFNRFIGRERPEVEKRLVAHILSTQQSDGSWPLFADGPGHLSVTDRGVLRAEARRARRTNDPALERARDFILAHGGLAGGRLHAIFLAYFGAVSVDRAPGDAGRAGAAAAVVPGINIYAMSSWARGTVVPLLVLMAKRPHVADRARRRRRRALAPPADAARDVRVPAPTEHDVTLAELLPRARPRAEARRPAARGSRSAAARSGRPPTGSSRTRTATAAGAASSRRWSTR